MPEFPGVACAWAHRTHFASPLSSRKRIPGSARCQVSSFILHGRAFKDFLLQSSCLFSRTCFSSSVGLLTPKTQLQARRPRFWACWDFLLVWLETCSRAFYKVARRLLSGQSYWRGPAGECLFLQDWYLVLSPAQIFGSWIPVSPQFSLEETAGLSSCKPRTAL